MKRVVDAAVLVLVAIFFYLALAEDQSTTEPVLRDVFVERGVREIGAINLVTAIYLGYRAYDTLGETAVLLLAVSGVMALVGRKE